MQSLAARFRRWYEYERDCNAKALEMLESVPTPNREKPEFQKAVDRLAHLVAARRRWLFRLGHFRESIGWFPPGTRLAELPAMIAEIEAAWSAYLQKLEDAELAKAFEYAVDDGRRFRWTIDELLTQLFGHAWYHRGQIAQLVAVLGGKAVDTDYIFWCKLTPIESTQLPR